MLRISHVTFAAEEPQRLSSFWAALLDFTTESGGDDCFARADGLELRFAAMPKSSTIELPIHLDVNAPDREATVRRALDLGAKLVTTKTQEIGELKETFRVLRDPEGNGFCIQGPDERQGRVDIGNITFSTAEPRRLGPFWSQALGRNLLGLAGRPESYPLNIDLLADDREAEIERLTANGATAVEAKTAGDRLWTVMRDPDANPFCVE